MKVQIFGVGVVGSAQACLSSHLGHEVIGYDPQVTVSQYAHMVKELERNVDLTFICTPEKIVETAINKLILNKVGGIYVIKSTVPSGTTRSLSEKYHIHICHNPEFLREKTSFDDVIHPTVVVIGGCCPQHSDILKSFYAPVECPIVMTTPTISETVKLTLNSYLATLITFWNEIDILSRLLGISTAEVARIVKYNSRVSAYGTEFFGMPFGGKCLPKDLEQTIHLYHQFGINPLMLEAVKDSNRKLDANPV